MNAKSLYKTSCILEDLTANIYEPEFILFWFLTLDSVSKQRRWVLENRSTSLVGIAARESLPSLSLGKVLYESDLREAGDIHWSSVPSTRAGPAWLPESKRPKEELSQRPAGPWKLSPSAPTEKEKGLGLLLLIPVKMHQYAQTPCKLRRHRIQLEGTGEHDFPLTEALTAFDNCWERGLFLSRMWPLVNQSHIQAASTPETTQSGLMGLGERKLSYVGRSRRMESVIMGGVEEYKIPKE